MKKLMIIVVAVLLSTGAMAQFRHYHGGGFYGPRYGVGVSLGFGYPYYPFGFPYYGYSYYGYPTKLDLKIEDIDNRYHYKKSLVKHDKNLSHKQKRADIRELKYQRKTAITQAKRDYYDNPGK